MKKAPLMIRHQVSPAVASMKPKMTPGEKRATSYIRRTLVHAMSTDAKLAQRIRDDLLLGIFRSAFHRLYGGIPGARILTKAEQNDLFAYFPEVLARSHSALSEGAIRDLNNYDRALAKVTVRATKSGLLGVVTGKLPVTEETVLLARLYEAEHEQDAPSIEMISKIGAMRKRTWDVGTVTLASGLIGFMSGILLVDFPSIVTWWDSIFGDGAQRSGLLVLATALGSAVLGALVSFLRNVFIKENFLGHNPNSGWAISN